MKNNKYSLSLILILSVFFSSMIYGIQTVQQATIDRILNNYLEQNKKAENLTSLSVGIGFPDNHIEQFFTGNVSQEPNAASINENNLFQIGSITKSFVSTIILQLESEGKLSLEQTIGDWLPQYPKWKKVTIRQLLNMTSGIPGYATNPALYPAIIKDIYRQWTNDELINIVYKYPIPTKGYDYSDTNYLLIGMIINKITHDTFENQLKKRILIPFNFKNTYYITTPYNNEILSRLVHGYYYGTNIESLIHGEDITRGNMSLAGEAGAMITSNEELVRWVRLLFSDRLFPLKQQQELKELVSMKNGKPIKTTDSNNPSGYALGIAQGYNPDFGIHWFYKGETIGSRSLYLFTPCNNLIISVNLNSAPFIDAQGQDNSGKLLLELYKAVLVENPSLKCANF